MYILYSEKLDKYYIGACIGPVMEGEHYIHQHKPDVVFLDIHMPGANGFNLWERFPEKNFYTVLTTGHPILA